MKRQEVWYQEKESKARHFVHAQSEPYEEEEIKKAIFFTPKGFNLILIEYKENEIIETIYEVEEQ